MIRTQLNLLDIDPQFQEILDCFSSVFDIRIGFFLPGGREFRVGRNKEMAEYCLLLRKQLGYEQKCIRLDACRQAQALKTGKIQSYVCHGGCREVIKPIMNNDEFSGYIIFGQVTSSGSVPPEVLKKAEQAGLSGRIQAAFKDLPCFNTGKLNEIIKLFSELTDLIVLKNLIKQKELDPVTKTINYMHSIGRRITLKEAARLVNLSESRLRHKFTGQCGRTFTQIQTSVLMKKAWEILSQNTNKTVKETAAELGYSDPLYFSKVFKKYFGYSPAKMAKKAARSLC